MRPLRFFVALPLLAVPLLPAEAAEPALPSSPIAWEPTVSGLVMLLSQRLNASSEGHPTDPPPWSPSDISLTYSFRADGDADSARSRTDAFDDQLAPDGVDLRWSEGRSSTEVHYVTLKLDWDFDGRAAEASNQRAESASNRVKQRNARAEERQKAIDLFVERRSLQGELLGRQLPPEQVWGKTARIAAINAQLDLFTEGGWSRLLAARAPASAPRWLSGLDAD